MNNSNKLGLFDLTIIAISFVIGMGIFKTPATIAAKSGTETIFYSAWLLGGFIALLGAFVFAEIGTRLPVTGAYYKVFSYAYHPAVGFTVNALILVSNAASLAVVALIGAEYCSDMLFGKNMGYAFNTTFAIVSVAIFYVVNLMGLRTSSRTQNVLMVLKIALVLLLIFAIFTNTQIEPRGYEGAPIETSTGDNALILLVLSMVAVSFTYGGYQQTVNFGAEIGNPRHLQKAITVGMIIIILLYLAVNYAYVNVIGFEKMKNATSIGALLFEALFGKWGGKIFDFAMFISVLAYVNIILMSNPRVMYAMAQDRVLPKMFAYQHPKTHALIPGVTVFSILTIVSVLFGKGVDNILGFTMFLDSIGFITAAIALLILRKKQYNQHLVQGKLTRYISIFSVLFILGYMIVATAVFINDWKQAVLGILLLLVFVVIYFIFFHKKSQLLPDERIVDTE